MRRQISREEAIWLGEHSIIDTMTDEMAVGLQLMQMKLFFPTFSQFHDKVERVLGRPVYTHEFAAVHRLADEFQRKTGITLDMESMPKESESTKCMVDSLNKVVDDMTRIDK